jgi:glycosyltransferase involved in cell wall biosynthesis
MIKGKPSICLVAHNAYGVLAGVDTGHIGGIEVQTPLMAKWLASNGYDVSMITWDEGVGQEDGGSIDGVRVYNLCRRDQGLPVARFLYPRWTSLVGALNRANPDIVYYNCGDLGLGQVVAWARRRRKKVLYSVANDVDCLQSLPSLRPLRERILYKYGLKRADCIVVQTETQKELLRNEYELPSTVIRMPSSGFDVEIDFEVKSRLPQIDKRVLWVGRLTEEKRLEWLLDIAEQCPNYAFDVLGGANVESNYSRQLIERARGIPNVKMHGRIPHDLMGDFYKKAAVLMSTSIYEGFPNVYLEAWSVGIPLITTFDPDGLVERHGHGVVCVDKNSLCEALNRVMQPDEWKSMALLAKDYFVKNHTISSSMSRFDKQFKKLANELS